MKTLVIIPCYNEEANILSVIANLQSVYPSADYLVVNDCSTDRSEVLLRNGSFQYITLPVNLGIGGGVQSGYMYAAEHNYDITVQMDGDGQHDPAYLSTLVDPVARGECDMCVGSRFITKEGFQTSRLRRMGILLLSRLIRLLSGTDIKDVTSGFRACGRELTCFFARNYAQDYPEPEAILSARLAGYSIHEMPVVMQERMGGKSSINTIKGAYYMLKVSLSLLTLRIIWSGRKEW